MPAALTLADVIAPDDFTSQDDLAAEQQFRYLTERRQVRVGPAVTIVFENRQTLWFRLQELSRVARLTSARSVQQELDWYNQLLPNRDGLQAAFWIALPGQRSTRELQTLRHAISLGRVGFRDAQGREILGQFRTDRVADRIIGLARWAEFPFTDEGRIVFSEPGSGWRVFVEALGYIHEGDVLPDAVWRSLLEDLGG